MAILEKGSFELEIGFIKLRGELSDLDRQCAWELYAEMSTRVAVTGKVQDSQCTDFEGEVLVESLDSLDAFFQAARQIMRDYPAGRTLEQNHLGVLICRIFQQVLRPFLERWQADFSCWWQYQSNPQLPPMQRQKEYPKFEPFLNDWTSLRALMRQTQEKLAREYKLIDMIMTSNK